MKIERDYEACCDNCDVYFEDIYTIYSDSGDIIIKLCKECLLKLLKAIIER